MRSEAKTPSLLVTIKLHQTDSFDLVQPLLGNNKLAVSPAKYRTGSDET